MKKLPTYFLLLFISITLTACSSLPTSLTGQQTPNVNPSVTPLIPHLSQNDISNTPIGGFIQNSMDETDKSKMWHALDNAVGKSTHWTNINTNIEYTVTPTKKITIDGNPFCRTYTIAATKGDKKDEVSGAACVGDDSNWKAIKQ